METILVTGGCGFIGSHVTLELLRKGYNVIVLDSNVNSSHLIIDKVKDVFLSNNQKSYCSLNFIKGDIRDESLLGKIFKEKHFNNSIINGVIHLAGLKSVKDSFQKSSEYWDVNVKGSENLLKIMMENNCNNLVFSSSATVYGEPKSTPIFEDFETFPINPYGKTKLKFEDIIKDNFTKYNQELKAISLRFFNPIGAHYSGILGEIPSTNNGNIFPNILNVALGKLNYLSIFGNNWPTSDGTAVRDFIHIMDVAEGHIAAIEFLQRSKPICMNINLGTGVKTSIMELINTFELVNNVKIPYKFKEKRIGDTPILLAEISLANKILNWKAKKSLFEMCKDGWNFAKINLR